MNPNPSFSPYDMEAELDEAKREELAERKKAMIKAIWKFPLEITDIQTVNMPLDAKILTVQMQGPTPCLWALVHPKESLKPRRIEIIGTGNPVAYLNRQYIGTIQQFNGSLVWHIFEII